MMCSVCVAVPSPSASAVFKEKVITPPLHTLIDAVSLFNEMLYWNRHLSLHSLVDVSSSDSISSPKSQTPRRQRLPLSGPCSQRGSVMTHGNQVESILWGPTLLYTSLAKCSLELFTSKNDFWCEGPGVDTGNKATQGCKSLASESFQYTPSTTQMQVWNSLSELSLRLFLSCRKSRKSRWKYRYLIL